MAIKKIKIAAEVGQGQHKNVKIPAQSMLSHTLLSRGLDPPPDPFRDLQENIPLIYPKRKAPNARQPQIMP